ncbi:spermatogenesis-associated protein 32 [Carlito syrichta]|uniref:Spermatogenesis-associated protein 32 n=1 Tax=Carlito syrichta TaxID=1868482 RepID=A0A1U7TF73_CARSF|nr:spermatogenesis-associated protein 32 [Carlito syrichta]
MEMEPTEPTENEESHKDSWQPEPRTEPTHPSVQENVQPGIMESPGAGDVRSVHVQTSQHLFWADKLVQASEHSLQLAAHSRLRSGTANPPTSPPGRVSTRILCPSGQPQAHPAPPAASSQLPRSPCLPSSGLPLALGLAEVINFASSLAMASSRKMDLPSLECMTKAPALKATVPSTGPVRPTAGQQEPEKSTEVLSARWLEVRDLQKAWGPEGRDLPCLCPDFSKPGIKRATIKGEVQLLQPPVLSPQPQGAEKDSVLGTKKGNPLLLKIHFKLSTPTTPEK